MTLPKLKIYAVGVALGMMRKDLENAMNIHRAKYNLGPPEKLENFTLIYNAEKHELSCLIKEISYPYPNASKVCDLIKASTQQSLSENQKLNLLICEYKPGDISLTIGTESNGKKELTKHKI